MDRYPDHEEDEGEVVKKIHPLLKTTPQKTWEPQGLILLGYAAEQGRSRERMPLEAVSLWR